MSLTTVVSPGTWNTKVTSTNSKEPVLGTIKDSPWEQQNNVSGSVLKSLWAATLPQNLKRKT